MKVCFDPTPQSTSRSTSCIESDNQNFCSQNFCRNSNERNYCKEDNLNSLARGKCCTCYQNLPKTSTRVSKEEEILKRKSDKQEENTYKKIKSCLSKSCKEEMSSCKDFLKSCKGASSEKVALMSSCKDSLEDLVRKYEGLSKNECACSNDNNNDAVSNGSFKKSWPAEDNYCKTANDNREVNKYGSRKKSCFIEDNDYCKDTEQGEANECSCGENVEYPIPGPGLELFKKWFATQTCCRRLNLKCDPPHSEPTKYRVNDYISDLNSNYRKVYNLDTGQS